MQKSSLSLTASDGNKIPIKGQYTSNVEHRGKSVPLLFVVTERQPLTITEQSNFIRKVMSVTQNSGKKFIEECNIFVENRDTPKRLPHHS